EERLRPFVIVEAEDIRLGDLSLLDGIQARGLAPVGTMPERAGERLNRMPAARPGENLRQQRCHALEFVLRLAGVDGAVAAQKIVGLVPDVPGAPDRPWRKSRRCPRHMPRGEHTAWGHPAPPPPAPAPNQNCVRRESGDAAVPTSGQGPSRNRTVRRWA